PLSASTRPYPWCATPVPMAGPELCGTESLDRPDGWDGLHLQHEGAPSCTIGRGVAIVTPHRFTAGASRCSTAGGPTLHNGPTWPSTDVDSLRRRACCSPSALAQAGRTMSKAPSSCSPRERRSVQRPPMMESAGCIRFYRVVEHRPAEAASQEATPPLAEAEGLPGPCSVKPLTGVPRRVERTDSHIWIR